MTKDTTPRLAQGREHVVATVDEIPSGTHKLVPIGRHGVGVYNVNGTFYAIANYCPHEGGPLCSGRARGRNVVDESVPGDAVMVRDLEFIFCPWHQWGFELATGTTAVKPEWSIRTYPVPGRRRRRPGPGLSDRRDVDSREDDDQRRQRRIRDPGRQRRFHRVDPGWPVQQGHPGAASPGRRAGRGRPPGTAVGPSQLRGVGRAVLWVQRIPHARRDVDASAHHARGRTVHHRRAARAARAIRS